MIGFGLVEGLFFAGSFCAIYYFRKRGLLPGLALSNDWIARDEGMHFSFSSLMYRTLRDKYNRGTLTDEHIKNLNLISGQNIVEYPEDAIFHLKKISKKIEKYGGGLLSFDYGYTNNKNQVNL